MLEPKRRNFEQEKQENKIKKLITPFLFLYTVINVVLMVLYFIQDYRHHSEPSIALATLLLILTFPSSYAISYFHDWVGFSFGTYTAIEFVIGGVFQWLLLSYLYLKFKAKYNRDDLFQKTKNK